MKRFTGILLSAVIICCTIGLTGCGSSEIPAFSYREETEDAAGSDETADTKESDATQAPGSGTDSGTDSETETAADDMTADGEEQDLNTNAFSDGIIAPEIQQPDLKAPEDEAGAFIRNMGIGFNLGNTFDAYLDPLQGDEMSTETCWGNPVTTKEMIRDIHAYGFDTIRIPVSWHNHVDADCNISEQWMARVKEVVDWAMDEGMYVIVNIHHDNHEAAHGFYPDRAHMDQSMKYITSIWGQVSEVFADYDEHLIFEGMNEPRLVDNEYEWWIDTNAPECREAIDCINELNQAFVDTVRASGGANATRYLMCPGYSASMDGATNPFFEIPEDIDGNEEKIILSVHAYTPYNFALEYPGVKDFDIDNKERTSEITDFMNRLYMDCVMQGVPVVIGEFGSRDKGGNLQDRVNFSAYFARMAQARNIACILWDNGLFTGDGELFGVYDRRSPSDSNTDIISALMLYKSE